MPQSDKSDTACELKRFFVSFQPEIMEVDNPNWVTLVSRRKIYYKSNPFVFQELCDNEKS